MSGTCQNASAINTIAQGGKVTCQSTLPTEFGASSDSTTVGTASTTVVSKILPAGNYLLTATQYATINPSATAAGQQVSGHLHAVGRRRLDAQTRTASIEVGQGTRTQTVVDPDDVPGYGRGAAGHRARSTAGTRQRPRRQTRA